MVDFKKLLQKEQSMSNDLDSIDKAWTGATPAAPGGTGFEPLPAGTKAKVAVMNQKPARVGDKQTPVCKVTFEVVEPTEYAGRRVWHDFWITVPNVPYLKRDLAILGWKGGKVSALMEETDASLINLGAVIEVDVEEYTDRDGNPRSKNVIRFFEAPYTPPAPGEAAKIEEDDSIPF